MRIPSLIAVLALVGAGFTFPAYAEPAVDATAATASIETVAPEACPANMKGAHVAKLSCCKAHKGICGCRAGKLVCCDNTTSSEAGCACHADEGFTE
jgi:hypothetical protein